MLLCTYWPSVERRDDWVCNSGHIVAKHNMISVLKLPSRARPVVRTSRVVVAASNITAIQQSAQYIYYYIY